ncbi:MAG TPA: ATP-binding protein [Candidatus Limnocylindrales bacterium]|nr:ATP-binding protein [Candidatus Limnocylindrales bacterium]
MSSSLDTKALLAYLAQPRPAPAAQANVDAWREAAAVLAAIARPETFQPLGGGPPGDLTAVLGRDLLPATGRKLRGRVMLTPEARYASLRDLAARGAIAGALEANPTEREGPVQAQLERYLLGGAPALEAQTLDELEATLQVAVWVRDAVPGVPSADAVEARATYLRLLAPFEAIAGDAVFRGRKHELDELRAYVGVLPVSSLLGRIAAKTLRWARPDAVPALSLHGPGGVGKSALVGRFMLEHTRLPDGGRIPFAYLDFDRAALDVADPYGLVTEMIRQLAAQFPVDRFEHMRATVEARAASRAATGPGGIEEAESVLADVLGIMVDALGQRPYLVVLDTFEEVQFRGEARAFPLWEMLARLQVQWPMLRVVVAGRAPVETLRLAGQPPRSMALGDLDTEAAIAFLGAQGVRDRQLAARLVAQYGGVPLSLKLVGALARDEDSGIGIMAAASPSKSSAAVGNEVVQGQLYERVLSHVHDERVRRLAHPGLVLRRITPEVIERVLNGPCELGVASAAEAMELFEALGRETSLMSLDDSDGALVHRSDLRRVILRLLLASEPGRVQRIREAAVAYYRDMGGRRGDAEVAYHRLHLGEAVEEEAFKDPEVRSSIQSSMAEFAPGVQRRLATLGFQVPPEALDQASLEEREQALASRVEALLPNGTSAVGEALGLLGQDAPSLDHPSPLYRSWARATHQAGDVPAATGWIRRGLAVASLANDTRMALGLLVERAWLEHLQDDPAAPATIATLAEAAARHEDRRTALLARLLASGRNRPVPEAELDGLASVIGGAPPDDAWALAPALRPVVRAALDASRPAVLDAIRHQVVMSGGPFGYVVLPDPRAQRILEGLLAREGDPLRFGHEFDALLDAWPYRILAVEPPYGKQGNSLYESAS